MIRLRGGEKGSKPVGLNRLKRGEKKRYPNYTASKERLHPPLHTILTPTVLFVTSPHMKLAG